MKGLMMGVLTTLLFTLWPLLGVREIRPASIFRRDVAPADDERRSLPARIVRLLKEPADWRQALVSLDRWRWFTALGMGLGLAGLAVWQAGSLKVGLLFIGALVVSVVLLRLAAFALIRALKELPKMGFSLRSLAIRQAIGNLHRPGSQAAAVMVSIGIGVMVIVAASLLEQSLVDHLGAARPVNSPTFFFIDIQPDQKDAFMKLLEEQAPGTGAVVTPLVRSRLYALNGERVQTEEAGELKPEEKDGEEGRGRERNKENRKGWYATREYVLTFLSDLPKDNTIVKGKWWDPAGPFDKPLVSIEEDAARNLGLDLGSIVQFDVQGATVTAEVSSIRKVEWGNFSTNFYMILSPGSLEGAPITYVATLRVPQGREAALQRHAVAAFPNVTAINIGDVLDSLARVLERLSLAIRAVALFCILTGGIVMAAALATTRYRRLYESVVLKALGATRGLVARSFAAEYALLGAIAGLIGVVLAMALSWGVLYFILDLPWRFHPRTVLIGFLLTLLLALSVGFLSTFRLLGQRPLAVLRHE
jgi:putative ABC transport system permease protein